MSDPNYQPPKTNPENPNFQKKKPAVIWWSRRKLLFLTFLPFSLCVGMSFLMMVNDNSLAVMNVLTVFILFLAGGIAIMTAAHFTRRLGGVGLHFVGYLVLWGTAHFALIMLGMFACTLIAEPRFLGGR